MGEVTVVYYSANRENEALEKKIIENLKKQANGLPITSVTQKPIDLGENICVGELPFSEKSALTQVLAGLKASKTRFCLAAESDFLYPPDYFSFVPPKDNRVYRYANVWVRWSHRHRFYKKFFSEGAQACGREFWIDSLEKALSERQEPFFPLGIGTKDTWTGDPAVTFKTDRGLHAKTPIDRRTEPCASLPYWGDLNEYVSLW